MKLMKLFCLLVFLAGCETNITNKLPDGSTVALPPGWEAIEKIGDFTYYVKDIRKDLCFVWVDKYSHAYGPQALVPCEKLENETTESIQK